MSDDGTLRIESRILDLFSDLDDAELDSVEQWICSKSYKEDLQAKKALLNSENILKKIGIALRGLVPFDAEMSTETITPPIVGDQADCNKVNTCHVDEFLYDEEQVTKLAKAGKLSRYYCLDCNSRKIEELTLISHSMSREALQYIFKVLLPKDLEDKQILDVGSRLGAVIYAAYYLTNATNIVGIEMNKELCEVQNKIISQFSMDNDRIKVVHSDVTERSDIVQNSNIIIINVLDFFVDIEKHKEMWRFFKKHIQKGSYLLCNRSMTETLSYLDMNEDLMNWLKICKPNQLENETLLDIDNCSELFLYVVK